MKNTPVHKRLTHGVAVRHQPTQLQNIDEKDEINGKINKEAAGTTKIASASTTTVAASGEAVFVPLVALADISKLSYVHLQLSSCSSKKHICINVKDKKGSSSSSSSFSIKIKTGYCLETVWDVPTSYSAIRSPSNEDALSTYWGNLSSTNYADTTFFTQWSSSFFLMFSRDNLLM